jgi:hypothetical protein
MSAARLRETFLEIGDSNSQISLEAASGAELGALIDNNAGFLGGLPLPRFVTESGDGGAASSSASASASSVSRKARIGWPKGIEKVETAVVVGLSLIKASISSGDSGTVFFEGRPRSPGVVVDDATLALRGRPLLPGAEVVVAEASAVNS